MAHYESTGWEDLSQFKWSTMNLTAEKAVIPKSIKPFSRIATSPLVLIFQLAMGTGNELLPDLLSESLSQSELKG